MTQQFLKEKGHVFPALVELHPGGSGASHVLVPGVIIFRRTHLACKHQSHCLLSDSVARDLNRQVISSFSLKGLTLTENQLLEWYTSTKFGCYSFHFPFAWNNSNNSMINLLLIWSMLFLHWFIKRHYPLCFWLVKYYYYKL